MGGPGGWGDGLLVVVVVDLVHIAVAGLSGLRLPFLRRRSYDVLLVVW